MSVTIAKCYAGHWVRTYTTTSTINTVGNVAFVNSGTSSRDSFHYGPNSIGQSCPRIKFYNESDKTIKYIHFEVIAQSQVNDAIGNFVKITGTGPIEPHSIKEMTWGYIWGDSSIDDVLIASIEIEYTDGTFEKQSLLEKGYPKVIYDGSVGNRNGWAIAMAIIFIIFMIADHLATNYYSSRYLMGSNFMHINALRALLGNPSGLIGAIIFLIPSIIAVSAAAAAAWFSKKKINKRATIISATVAFATALYSRLPAISYIYESIDFSGRIWYMNADNIRNIICMLGSICGIVMFILFFITAIGKLGHYSNRSTIATITYVISCILILVIFMIYMSKNVTKMAEDLWQYVNLMSAILWPTIPFTALLCIRSNYDIK